MVEVKVFEGEYIGKKYKPGFSFGYKISVPCVDQEEFAVFVNHDGVCNADVGALLQLAEEGKAPYCISLGIWPGNIVMPDGSLRKMRMNSYDLFDKEYADFLVYEFIPHVTEKYSLKFYESPDMHYVAGGSSGGISAFVIAWFHPEYFRRVYMSSPSFLAMARGNEIPYLIRKYETKPIRIYEEYSENEPNDYFGWSRAIDEESRAALEFAGYDFAYEFFPGEGHCSRRNNAESAYKRNEWIWRGWKDEAIKAPRNSGRVDQLVGLEDQWEKCDSFPEKNTDGLPAFLTEKYDHVVLSNDGMAYYAASVNDDIVYMFVNDDLLSAERSILHATLHTIPRFNPKGAIDIAVDRSDRLFVLTAIGIQCVRSFGLIDVILNLPDNANPLRIAVTDALYVETENGIYRRRLAQCCTENGETKRNFVSYYDGVART